MTIRVRLGKLLALIACSGILFAIQCPPLLVDSIKTGTYNWVSGSFRGVNLVQLSDFILNGFTGGPTLVPGR